MRMGRTHNKCCECGAKIREMRTSEHERAFCKKCFVVVCDPTLDENIKKFNEKFSASHGDWIINTLKYRKPTKGNTGRYWHLK